MYNRYIPQPDGSYRRKHIQDKQPQAPSTPLPRSPEKAQVQPKESPNEPRAEEEQKIPACQRVHHPSAGGFLRNLLPKDFDTGDLLVILLILIMAGDSEDGQNNALLTLALYLLM